MSVHVMVTDSTNGQPLGNAYFSHNWVPEGGGRYWVDVPGSEYFWSDAEGYQMEYAYSDGYTSLVVSLARAAWPAT